MLPERGSKQQQQQLSHKESRWTRSKRSVHESEMPKVAPKGTKHRPSSAPPLPAVLAAQTTALRRIRRHRSTLRAATWPQQAPPSPLRASAGRPTSRCGAPPTRALPCPSARSRRAHRGHGTLTPPSEPAGGSLLPPPPPPRVGRSSSAIIAGCTVPHRVPRHLVSHG